MFFFLFLMDFLFELNITKSATTYMCVLIFLLFSCLHDSNSTSISSQSLLRVGQFAQRCVDQLETLH